MPGGFQENIGANQKISVSQKAKTRAPCSRAAGEYDLDAMPDGIMSIAAALFVSVDTAFFDCKNIYSMAFSSDFEQTGMVL